MASVAASVMVMVMVMVTVPVAARTLADAMRFCYAPPP